MRSWLAKANVFRASGYEINWDVVYDLLHMDEQAIDQLYELAPEQRYFLWSLICFAEKDYIASNKVANHARSVFSVRITTKNLVKDVIEPLQERGFIESRKVTAGRGAKPHDVKLTEKSESELLAPILASLADLTNLTSAELSRTFESVAGSLADPDKYVRGIALELFAIWIIRLVGLRFSDWRLRHHQSTGGAEVDVMAASDRVIYNRWQIQCKNIKGKVDVDTVAKEVGLTFLTKADVVMMVTTGGFTSDAVNYANQVMETTRYYIILLDGDDINRIVEDRAKLIDILNVKARRVFARKELGITDFTADPADEAAEEMAEEVSQLEQNMGDVSTE